MIRIFLNHYEPAHVMTQGLWTSTSECVPWNFEVSSILCKGWSFLSWFGVELLRSEFIKSIDLMWTCRLYTYILDIYFILMEQLIDPSNSLRCILHSHCKVLILSKKHQANLVALHSVLRGWHFTPGCFGGWRCCLGAQRQHVASNQNPEILAEILEQVLDCWTLFVWLLKLLLRYFDYEIIIIYYIFIAGTFSLPSLQTQFVLVV